VVQGGVTSAILNAVVAEDLPGPGTVFLHVDWNFRAPVRPGTRSPARSRSRAFARTSPSPSSPPACSATMERSSSTDERCVTRCRSAAGRPDRRIALVQPSFPADVTGARRRDAQDESLRVIRPLPRRPAAEEQGRSSRRCARS
jgi:hypothetical protein